ncbi:MAG: Rrf2 family transcriptional regulator [Acidaminococcaceae bacterium]|nr:Rrf2 family transcriptional regulator [Acidaminococcaceae bacterium]
MRISTKGRYATRLMLDLALHYECGYIPLKAVSQRQNISDKYLEQIITQLSRAGFVRSARGAQGGYQLTKSPEEYTVGDILRITEGSLSPVSCIEANGGTCEMAPTCVTMEVWQQIEDAVNSVVDHITLADLVKRYHEKAGGDYVI